MTTVLARRAGALVTALVATAGAFTLNAAVANAAPLTRYVATTGDDTDNDCTAAGNPCATVQHAVNEAAAGDTVSIASGTYDESVRIRKALTLVGAGAAGPDRSTIDGASGDAEGPSIWVDGTDTGTPPDVVVRDLDVSNNASDEGIFIFDASATVEDSVVANNDDVGIAIEESEADASLVVARTTVSGNGDDGVLVQSGATATITDSTLKENKFGGIEVDSSDATVTTSTLSGNLPHAGDSGSEGGCGVCAFFSTVQVDTSTIFGNTGQGILGVDSSVTADNSTISGTIRPADEGGERGGLQEFPYGGVATAELPTAAVIPAAHGPVRAAQPKVKSLPAATLTATIVADNTTLHDCNGDVTDGSYNLASDDSCAFGATGSKNSGNAKLGPLADNGGPTLTLEPAKGSDALDKIPSGKAGCVVDATDQRGVSRPQGAKCDIGAVEVSQPPVVISPNSLPHGTVGIAYHQTITATGGLGAPYVWSLAGGALPPGLTFSAAGVISGVPTAAGTFHITVSVDDPTEKDYTIVIVAPTAPSTAPSTEPIANTGAHVRPLASVGGLAVALGVLMLFASGALARWARRYRRAH